MTRSQPAADRNAEMRGKVALTETSLEMYEPPEAPPLAPPDEGVEVRMVPQATVPFYRFLYNTVGEPWLWEERRRISDAELDAILLDPKVDLLVLYVDNQPAGFAELDARSGDSTELAFFGLLPQFTGRKLGPLLLDHAVRRAFESGARRLWVHTCTIDHPAALGAYKKAGFKPYQQVDKIEDDPRVEGLIPEHAAPHVPIIR